MCLPVRFLGLIKINMKNGELRNKEAKVDFDENQKLSEQANQCFSPTNNKLFFETKLLIFKF